MGACTGWFDESWDVDAGGRRAPLLDGSERSCPIDAVAPCAACPVAPGADSDGLPGRAISS